MSAELLQRLETEPDNLVIQLRAMTDLSQDARTRHRDTFDVYLLAAANFIEATLRSRSEQHKDVGK